MAEKEYIEREAFLQQKREQYCKDCARRKGMRNGKYKILYEIGEAPCRACEIDDALNDVEDFPAADVRPVVRAVWRRYSPLTDTYECSNCGEQVIDEQFRTNFCPNCGADMRGEQADVRDA